MRDLQIVSAQEMRLLDRLTIKEKGITSFELMTHAGMGIFKYIIAKELLTLSDTVLVVSSTGNNGGDGLIVAGLLADMGVDVKIEVL